MLVNLYFAKRLILYKISQSIDATVRVAFDKSSIFALVGTPSLLQQRANVMRPSIPLCMIAELPAATLCGSRRCAYSARDKPEGLSRPLGFDSLGW